MPMIGRRLGLDVKPCGATCAPRLSRSSWPAVCGSSSSTRSRWFCLIYWLGCVLLAQARAPHRAVGDDHVGMPPLHDALQVLDLGGDRLDEPLAKRRALQAKGRGPAAERPLALVHSLPDPLGAGEREGLHPLLGEGGSQRRPVENATASPRAAAARAMLSKGRTWPSNGQLVKRIREAHRDSSRRRARTVSV